jgi:hypothetical protein
MNPTATEPTTRFKIYTLRNLLPDEDTLQLNIERGVLSQIHAGKIVEQQIFSPGETWIVKSLFENYPDYCPYEDILHEMTGKSVDECREAMYRSSDENGTIDPVMRPVRNIMGRSREKLHPFGIQITSIVNLGYVLNTLKAGMHKEK